MCFCGVFPPVLWPNRWKWCIWSLMKWGIIHVRSTNMRQILRLYKQLPDLQNAAKTYSTTNAVRFPNKWLLWAASFNWIKAHMNHLELIWLVYWTTFWKKWIKMTFLHKHSVRLNEQQYSDFNTIKTILWLRIYHVNRFLITSIWLKSYSN